MTRRYERLEADPVGVTAARLVERVSARLPGRDLIEVARELPRLVSDVATGATTSRRRLRVARLASRIGSALVLVVAAVVLVLAARDARGELDSSIDWLPLIETTVNDLVFVAIAVFFLYTVPARLERRRLLTLLHRIRSLAHIIDMHQLTKDPERVRSTFQPTEASVMVGLDRDEMRAYLEYCTELLSLVAKTAALCAEESQDTIVLDTVRGIETLCAGLSADTWQKLTILASPNSAA